MTACEENLLELLSHLNIQALEGVALLDREAPVRHLASATLRGLAGHALKQYAPEMIDRWFKPGVGNDAPSAYLFQPLYRRSLVASHFQFRIITWDPLAEFLPAMRASLTKSQGTPFGETGAQIERFEWGEMTRLIFTAEPNQASAQRIYLHTPFRYKRRECWVDEHTLDLDILVRATITRLNHLSQAYGKNIYLHARPFIELASSAIERSRRLCMIQPRRRSSTQNQNIDLSGLVGDICYENLPAPIVNLLLTAGVFHIGKHTVEGCGHVLLAPVSDPGVGVMPACMHEFGTESGMMPRH